MRGVLTFLVLVALAAPGGCAWAAAPPLHLFTIADGLPSNAVTAILPDATGFLWIGTRDGLARYDGVAFVVFSTSEGLPSPDVTSLAVDRGGRLFVGTSRGVARLRGDDEPRGTPFIALPVGGDARTPARAVNALAVDPAGRLLAATEAGLWAWRGDGWDEVALAPRAEGARGDVETVYVDARGNVWTATGTAVVCRAPDGALARWTYNDELPNRPGTWVMAFGEDAAGRLWAGGSEFLWRFVAAPRAGAPLVAQEATHELGSRPARVFSLARRGAALVAGTGVGVFTIDASPGSNEARIARLEDRVVDARVVTGDADGNVWCAAATRGLGRLAAHGLTWYDERDGLPPPQNVDALAATRAGELYALVAGFHVMRWNGGGFDEIGVRWARPGASVGWGAGQRLLVDHTGTTWMPTVEGLVRWPARGVPARALAVAPERVYGIADGLPSRFVAAAMEDSRGDLWLALDWSKETHLCRWVRARDSIECFPPASGGPERRVGAMTEDRAGNVWFGLDDGRLGRWRRGRFDFFGAAQGFDAQLASALLAAKDGRLWIAARHRGLCRVDDPDADAPAFRWLGARDGISSTDLHALAEDDAGRVYVAGGRGIDRLDLGDHRVRHYGPEDGVLETNIVGALRAADGSLWFGTSHGVGRLVPEAERAPEPPFARITGLRVAGEPWPLGARGARDVGRLTLDPTQRDVSITYTGLARHGRGLRFETRLDGAEEQWTAQGATREITYTRLAPGRYRLLVRAIDETGAASEPASVRFVVLAPLWRRGWFLALAAGGAGALLYAYQRQRVQRLVEIERVRTHIATDLHDDIGAGLSQIVVATQAVRRELPLADGPARERLDGIARVAAELVDVLSDVVWSINPARDHVGDLAQRMRRAALELLEPRDIELAFRADEAAAGAVLDTHVRRHVFLALKELVHNVAKHSGAQRAEVTLERRGGHVVLTVADDGRGLPTGAPAHGHGLSGTLRRAQEIGGTFHVRPRAGGGTLAVFDVPERPPRPARRPRWPNSRS